MEKDRQRKVQGDLMSHRQVTKPCRGEVAPHVQSFQKWEIKAQSGSLGRGGGGRSE